MRTEEVADGSRLSAATRYELLVGVSNAIGTYRDPQELFGALVRELHRVVRFDYIGVSIRDEKSNTFHRHIVEAETEAAIPPDPELATGESDARWVYEPRAFGHFARSPRRSILQIPRDFEEVRSPLCVHSPLNHSPQQSRYAHLWQ
jgi:hypothetical protein